MTSAISGTRTLSAAARWSWSWDPSLTKTGACNDPDENIRLYATFFAPFRPASFLYLPVGDTSHRPATGAAIAAQTYRFDTIGIFYPPAARRLQRKLGHTGSYFGRIHADRQWRYRSQCVG